MITLYGYPDAPPYRKVLWLMAEAGITCRVVPIDILKGEQNSPSFRALNPCGKVPVIDDGGFILWDSNAISWYLADRYAPGTLVPSEPTQRALVQQWTSWQSADMSPALSKPWYLKFLAGIWYPPFDPRTHAEACEAAQPQLRMLDDHLRGRSYLVNDTLSIADIACAEMVRFGAEGGIDLSPFEHVRPWFEALRARPAFLASHGAG